MDITLMPLSVLSGLMDPSSPVAFLVRPKALGMEGPVMSASRMAQFYPLFCMVVASMEVTKDLPTPPLPLTTATMCLIVLSL